MVKTIYATNPLCGNYVIGGAPSDYVTLKEAVDTLNSAGVSCDVVFDIKPGNYNAQYLINEINDAGQNSTITFQSQTGDSTDVILTTDSTDYLFNLNGADYIRFKQLTFSSDSAEKLVILDSSACYNVFESNQFMNGVYQICNTGTTVTNTNNLIDNNLFLDGFTAIYFIRPWNSPYETNNTISSNKFENQSENSIEVSYQENLSVVNNVFEANKNAFKSSNLKNSSITNNNIKADLSALILESGDSIFIANNFIICGLNMGYYSGIFCGSDNSKFYNNTIKLIGEKNGRGLFGVFSDNNDFKNNVLINLRAGRVFSFEGNDNTSNYNCLYTNGVSLVNSCADLATWQATSGQDSNSISTLPVFYSETDLHTNSLVLDGAGIPLPEITDDIDGETRDALNPDIGADEFTSTCTGPLAGAYTIGTSGDYSTFNKAVTTLFDCGINGSVTFNIEDGTYNEQLLINEIITGYTEDDTITFQSATRDSTSVILTYKADTLNNYT